MEAFGHEKMKSDFRVGLISFLAIGLLVAGITMTGGTKGLIFTETAIIKALMQDVGGLNKGSAVTMAGMNIGQVKDIIFPFSGHYVEVKMEIQADLRHRIKDDSVPSIRTQGMLGDRYIEISMGSENAKTLPERDALMGEHGSQFDETINRAEAVLTETEKLLGAINQQTGTVGQLFYNEELYHTLNSTIEELRELIIDFKANPKKYIDLDIF